MSRRILKTIVSGGILLPIIFIIWAIPESGISDRTSTLSHYIFEGQISKVSVRDGRTGEFFELTDDLIIEFNELFYGTSFVVVEVDEDIVGYIYSVKIESDSDDIHFSRSSSVTVDGSPMSFESSQRYGEIMTFLEEHMSNEDDKYK